MTRITKMGTERMAPAIPQTQVHSSIDRNTAAITAQVGDASYEAVRELNLQLAFYCSCLIIIGEILENFIFRIL